MKLLPASLATRTVLLIVAAIALAELATFSLIFQHGRAAHADRTAQFIGGQIRFLQASLSELDAKTRQRLITREGNEQWLQLRPDNDTVPPQSPRFGFARRLEGDLSRVLGEPVVMRHGGPGRGLWIGFMAGQERWWLVLPPPRFEPQSLPPDLWYWLFGTLALLIGAAALFVRGIVGPLARLGEAVAATGDGSARTVIPEGPKEVQRLAERHNTMVRQLTNAEADRREMLAGLTHDLRAPLARLRVRLALLENAGERDGLARDADDMERIVGQCLAFLQTEVVSLQTPTPLMFADAVSNEVARHCELGRPVSMRVSDDAAACAVAIAPGSVQRLLDNLIDNALQHGQPPVEVSLTRPEPDRLALTIRDHGVGIAEAQRARVLDAFVQIEPARATSGRCGLGLAIVRRIVDGCGGTLALTEAEGGGLSVTLTFPTAQK